MTLEKIHREINSILAGLHGELSDEAFETLNDLLKVKEYRVGFEILSDFLHEDRAMIDRSLYDRLVAVGEAPAADDSYWKELAHLVQ